MKYLYIFETGAIWQMDTPPTQADYQAIKQGLILCFRFEAGKPLVELDSPETTRPVPDGKHYYDPIGCNPYSFITGSEEPNAVPDRLCVQSEDAQAVNGDSTEHGE